MVASRWSAVCALVAPTLMVGSVLLWQRANPAAPFLPEPASAARPAAQPTPRQALLSAGTTRIIRAGVFQMPSLNLADLAVGPLTAPSAESLGRRGAAPACRDAAVPLDFRPDPEGRTSCLVRQAALEIMPEDGFDTEPPPEEGDIPGDPIRDGLKAGATGWPTVDRSAKGDQRVPGLRPSVSEAHGLVPMDPLLPDEGAPPLAQMPSLLDPLALGVPPERFRQTHIDAGLAAIIAERLRRPASESDEGEGAVPLDHSLAPTGGTSPAASRPDLAHLDSRTTGPDGEAPIQLTALPADAVVTMAAVRPTPGLGEATPAIGPDEGLTTQPKSGQIAGLPGLDDGQPRPLTLPPVAYTRAQICLATAVYFEARGESEKGQIAVAQVVINRVRSPYYPKNVCDVVYQGASERRWGGCQFSFACDRIKDRITEDGPWKAALSIAQKVMDAELWLPEVGNATHYHATYVRPYWVRDMREMDRIGRHIFYRVKWWT